MNQFHFVTLTQTGGNLQIKMKEKVNSLFVCLLQVFFYVVCSFKVYVKISFRRIHLISYSQMELVFRRLTALRWPTGANAPNVQHTQID